MRLENSFVLVPGIGRKTEENLWENGVTQWSEFENADVIGESRREKCASFLGKARKNLEVGNTVFFGDKLPNNEIWRMYGNFDDRTCFFDIETTGLSKEKNKVTTVTFHVGGETRTLVRGKDLNEENIRDIVSKSQMLVSFNGKRFDVPFLEHNFDLDFRLPHLDLMYTCKRLGYSGGLKQVEKDMGLDRGLEDIDGREAVRLWKEYSRKGREESLEKLVEYNRYDTVNLEELMRKVYVNLSERVFKPYSD